MADYQPIPLDIVGGNEFGRYPKISVQQTYNMIISDGWLVDYAGYKNVLNLIPTGIGRAIFSSARGDFIIAVIDEKVFRINFGLIVNEVGALDSFNGDVFIDENDVSQIAICDRKNIYIYNYSANTFVKAVTGFTAGYVAFQDGYFIAANSGNPKWELSKLGDGTVWPQSPNTVGTFQTKPDNVVACVRLPSKENQLLVIGHTVTELWNDVGYQIFPYVRTSGFNIDYGCVNPSTIATADKFVVWVGQNEKSGPVILYTDGGEIQQISNDGINFKLANLVNPSNSYGMMYKQDGHLFYHLTFADPADNFTLLYDFNTQKFFYLTDQNMNHHIAKRVCFFNGNYYFVSFVDGNIYQLSSQYTTFDGHEVPRIRIPKTIRMDDSSTFIAHKTYFPIEQGEADDEQRVDICKSNDGGVTFGNYAPMGMNKLGARKNLFQFWNLGLSNELTLQFRFQGTARFVVGNGFLEYYK